jgi:predicted ATPase
MTAIGLAGSSGVGKTTLAKSVAEKTGIPFVPSQTRPAYAVYGFLPEMKMTHTEKMKVQHLILDMAETDYRSVNGLFITDRTPMDFAAHVLAEATATNLNDEETAEMMEYINRCYKMTNLYFSSLIFIQPAIKMVSESGRTSNAAYVEHINLIMLGLITDPNNKLYCAKHNLRKTLTDLNKRTEVVIQIARLVEINNLKQAEQSVSH